MSHYSDMISFRISSGNELLTERMHAVPLGENRYRLDNSPFYAYGISAGDVFLAEDKEGELVFSKILSRGGHSTYRIKLGADEDHEFFLRHWAPLEALGCTFEGSSRNPRLLYSIDVPPNADVFEIYRLLEKGEKDGIWIFEEGHYFDPKS